MARIVLTNVAVTFGTTDISSYVTSVTLSSTLDNSVAFEFNQDYAASALEATIYPTIGTAVSVTVRPVAGSSPAYSFSALVSEWTPLNGAVGELATASVTWPISGTITKS
jgi:hypothetical protein